MNVRLQKPCTDVKHYARSIWATASDNNLNQNVVIVCNYIIDQQILSYPHVTALTLNDWYVKQQAMFKPGSVRKRIAVVQGWLKFMNNMFPDMVNITWNPKLPKVPGGNKPYLEPEQIEAIMDWEPEGTFKYVVASLLNTGMRISELFSLGLGDIQDDKVIVYDGKGGKDRQIPITGKTAWYLRKITGGAMTKRTFRAKWCQMRTDLELSEAIVPHTLRHTYATSQATLGTPMAILQAILGHSDIQTTMKYVHVSPNHLQGFAKDLA